MRSSAYLGPRWTFFGNLAVLRSVRNDGIYPVMNFRSAFFTFAGQKTASMQLLYGRDRLRSPILRPPGHRTPANCSSLVGGAPVVIQALLEGTQGIGAWFSAKHRKRGSIIQGLCGVRPILLVQQFVKESNGEDIRLWPGGGDPRSVASIDPALGQAGGLPFGICTRWDRPKRSRSTTEGRAKTAV